MFYKVVVILCLSICIAGYFNSVFLLISSLSCLPASISLLLPTIIINTTNLYYLTLPIHNREEAITSASESCLKNKNSPVMFLMSKKDQVVSIYRGRFPSGWVSSISSSITDNSLSRLHSTFASGNYHLLRAFLNIRHLTCVLSHSNFTLIIGTGY